MRPLGDLMQRFIKSLLVSMTFLAGASLAAQSVQLADGRMLLASVEEANGDGALYMRLATFPPPQREHLEVDALHFVLRHSTPAA